MYLFSLVILAVFSVAAYNSLEVKLETRRALDSRLANIHVSYSQRSSSPILYTYGACSSLSQGDAHHEIARISDGRHDRLLWRIPKNVPSGGCLSAWNVKDQLVGRSKPQTFRYHRRHAKRAYSVAMDNSSGIDAEGPWFNGVAALQDKQEVTINVPAAKSKQVAIVGAGMAGLMIWLNLNMVGMKNVTIVEAAQRLGGRVHTAYIGPPADRQYQEVGSIYNWTETSKCANIVNF